MSPIWPMLSLYLNSSNRTIQLSSQAQPKPNHGIPTESLSSFWFHTCWLASLFWADKIHFPLGQRKNNLFFFFFYFELKFPIAILRGRKEENKQYTLKEKLWKTWSSTFASQTISRLSSTLSPLFLSLFLIL